MSKIFDDSDSEIEVKTDNEYAKKYDTWRKKEELNKLKTRYGEELWEEESSSSSDDEEGIELTEEIEKQFFKTLSCLKNKDPRIYDQNVEFFEKTEATHSHKKAKKEKAMYLNDYEREMILKNNGELSDNEDEIMEDPRSKSPTYVQEQQEIKERFKKALGEVTENDTEEEWGGMLKKRHKTKEEEKKEDEEYKEWLAGQKDEIEDSAIKSDLKPLKDYWNNPNLDEGEKFLRDYILQKRFLNTEDEDYIPTYEEVIHDSDDDLSEDENMIERQEEFEHKYNFRFEEPDQEFIKRYPRTVEHSLRKTDDRRKIKRAETKERKVKEKEQKKQELRKLQELKKKEIEEKIQKLKEITGNDDLEFKDEDLEEDFDPETYDRKMQSVFNDEFYQGAEGDQKPQCPELDEYLEIENWEQWKGEDAEENGRIEEHTPHCEDEDFNMDCDYDSQAVTTKELIDNSKGKKKRKRKSNFAKAISQPKPAFDPNDKTYEQYLDEYYKFDCEDIIGDVHCKFKYRKVVPNDFGLTIVEILTANDRELNKWCSLKKTVQHRPDHVEKYEQIAYAKKGCNIDLKRRILPTLFESEEEHKVEDQTVGVTKKKKGKKIRCKKSFNVNETEKVPEHENSTILKKKKKKKKKRMDKEDKTEVQKSDHQIENSHSKVDVEENTSNTADNVKTKIKKHKTHKTLNSVEQKIAGKRKLSDDSNRDVVPRKKKKGSKGHNMGISDARLSAYGINPKKFKNKLKYGQA